jgi:hypothetical protein
MIKGREKPAGIPFHKANHALIMEREVSREPMEAYIPPTDEEERVEALPEQEEFWRPPVRFGSIPVEKEPLGWDKRKGFYKLFPRVSLPFQIVERVSFGHPDLPANRLIWGDNLHVMRQLPSESIDLIYIDPPFFSGRQYNIIFGDQNEVRSFTDIWEGGMPGYLIWLNARLYEMKRLLKKTGSIYVHCDWHASHYIKVEMDKIFGYENFLNEVVWCYGLGGSSNRYWPRKHDVILWYSKVKDGHFFEPDLVPATSMRMAGQLKKAPRLLGYTDNQQHGERTNRLSNAKTRSAWWSALSKGCPPGGECWRLFLWGWDDACGGAAVGAAVDCVRPVARGGRRHCRPLDSRRTAAADGSRHPRLHDRVLGRVRGAAAVADA